MDEITRDIIDQDPHAAEIVGSHCSVREYRVARQEFFAAVEKYRRASEEYLEALEANHTSATSDQHKARRENLEEKRLKREAALLVAIANLELTKSKGEAI